MINKKFSRRTFLKASAATTALASVGSFSLGSWQRTQASEKGEIKITPTLCNACSNKCGLLVYTKNGRIWKVKGHPSHPMTKGKLCARGHGYAMIAYSPDRLTRPLKKLEDGTFTPISWEQAYKEIAQKVKGIMNNHGPESLVFIQDPRPTGSFYGPRFMAALGSPNTFTHQSVCNNAGIAGFSLVIGGYPSADIANSKYIMFIGRSYGDGVRPSSLEALNKAKENGAKVVLVDPRLNSTAPFADEWLAIRPGTDLAFVLAMTNVLINENLYDKEFVESYSIGFEEYKQEVSKFTPEWAEKITDISKETIIRIAKEMAKMKPQAIIEQSWRGGFGCTYYNGTETARTIAAFNALLGNYQQKGGMLFGGKSPLGKLDENIHPTPPKSSLARMDADYPLAPKSSGVANVVPQKAKEGKVKGAFIIQTNPVRNYANPQYMIEGFKNIDIKVVIDIQMTETALIADYVLPEPSFIERTDVIDGSPSSIYIRQQVIERVHPDTVPADEIFVNLAKEMGIGKYFNFTLEELNKSFIAPLGITLEQLKEKGVIPIENKGATTGSTPSFNTPSGKIEFYSETVKNAGFSPVPTWIEPKVMPDQDSFRLITGKQSFHTHTFTTNLPYLMQITKDYDAERLWINKGRADQLGIKDGDVVLVESSLATSKIKVKVTERLHPDCVFVPSPYGSYSEHLNTAKGVGFSYCDHVPGHIEPMGGTGMIHEVIVKLRKVGI